MKLAALALPLCLIAAGCGTPPELHATDGYVALPAVPGNPAAAYFTLKGGTDDNALISVTAPRARRAEIHRSMTGTDGRTSMDPVNAVPVPNHGETRLEPGGLHVMLFGLDGRIRPGEGVELQLGFESGPTIIYTAPARAAGAAPAAE